MKPEAQRIAIAEACGWKCCEPRPRVKDHPYARWLKGDEMCAFQDLPNYIHDLNAMNEAERCLTQGQVWHYCKRLMDRTGTTWPAINATAAQRAEAFLRTIGKWEDGK